jgi:hypothetical protein
MSNIKLYLVSLNQQFFNNFFSFMV